MTSVPPAAWLAALSALPEVGPARLRSLLDGRTPEAVWDAIVRRPMVLRRWLADPSLGVRPQLIDRWHRLAVAACPEQVWRGYAALDVGVLGWAGAHLPAMLADDPDGPAVLFARGDPDLLTGPRVAIVGTRRCTRYGRSVAWELARDLAQSGARVISGLALGVDAAAHHGAISVEPRCAVGVVATGLDVVYPQANAGLWETVAEQGLLLSEAPCGVPPARWRFPARNRLIAAIADVVVVVESPVDGGSMHTVREAMRRDRPVMAVPGPIGATTSAGTNRLLADGCAPVLDAEDVRVALGLVGAGQRSAHEPRRPPAADEQEVLDALGWFPSTIDQLIARTGGSIDDVLGRLARLAGAGWVADEHGWYVRLVRPDRFDVRGSVAGAGDPSL